MLRIKKIENRIGLLVIFLGFLCVLCTVQSSAQDIPKKWQTIDLNGKWRMRPATKDPFVDSLLAMHNIKGPWMTSTVPGTVMGGLVENGMIPDPFFAENLKEIPEHPFRNSWLFEKDFLVEGRRDRDNRFTLCLDGINYRASVYMNGHLVAGKDSLFGAYRNFQLDVSKFINTGTNTLRIVVNPPQVRDFYMGFVDWAPTPPDHFMGIFRGVEIRRSSASYIQDVYVQSKLGSDDGRYADLQIDVALSNLNAERKILLVQIDGVTIRRPFRPMDRNGNASLHLDVSHYPELRFVKPKLWWPNGMGDANLYTAKVAIMSENGVAQDCRTITFGIRKIETFLDKNNVRKYKVNGKYMQVKGAGWVDDLFLRYNPAKDSAQIAYAKDMHLNALRLEGVWGNTQHLYDLCDRNGIMLMVGWSCQWEWPDYLGLPLNMKPGDENLPINEGVERYAVKLTDKEKIFLSTCFHDQVYWLRQHPSILTWVVGSDAIPPPDLEKSYRNILGKLADQPLLVSAGDFESQVSGSSGMKMNGPYQYVPPGYWYADQRLGQPYGFNSEIGTGPQIPVLASIKQFIPEDKLWPVQHDSVWRYHAGRKDFSNMDIYLDALDKRYGKSKNMEEFAYKAQLANYETMRAMFESHVISDSLSGGLIEWMMNAPWPKFYWQLYDFYLMPNAAYYGVKKALSSHNIIYNYQNNRVYLSSLEDSLTREGYALYIKVLDRKSQMLLDTIVPVKSAPDRCQIDLQQHLSHYADPAFILLELKDKYKKVHSDNFYWISNKMDTIDWKTYSWYYSPIASYADLTYLNQLPSVDIKVRRVVLGVKNGLVKEAIYMGNNSSVLSFFNELQLFKGDAEKTIVPVIYSDNYFPLFPQSEKCIIVSYPVQKEGARFLLSNMNGNSIRF